MIQIHIIMNSPVEEILAKKCCNIADQNLEIHLTNTGEREVVVRGFFDLESESETLRIENLYPWGDRNILPGESLACYCSMEERTWEKFDTINFYDDKGNRFTRPIDH